jgi:hypothetical protein
MKMSTLSNRKHFQTATTTTVTSPVLVPEIMHQWDPNLPQEKIDELFAATNGGDPEAVRKAQEDFVENSPYEEVRAAVKNTDDEEPANTVRAWVLGMTFVTLASGLNMFLSMRSPAINFPPIVILLYVALTTLHTQTN